MKWGRYWPECLLTAISFALYKLPLFRPTDASSPLVGSAWTSQRKLAARERTRELWYHGYDNYMTYAFPMDELMPLSCSGQGPDWGNPTNIAANDVAGNFSLTLIDVLDTLVVLDDRKGFETAIKNIIEWVSFNVDTKPQVFETTIRVLGGLLSGHIYANQTGQPFFLPWYRGELLNLAHDLGNRLLPAFSTPTGLPYARVNLRHGVVKGETLETCTAGAGSLILEFGTLSRLTGDDRFEKAAQKAFFGIWNRKSDLSLVGNTINTYTGKWTAPEITGIGAGIDSFYEYALKWYILSGDVEFLDVWDDAYSAIMRYSRATDGYWYRVVNMNSGDLSYFTIDSLSAFWPGLQVLAGDIENAIKLHMIYWNIWKQHSGLPEVYDTNYRVATSHQYPLRPEFIESTWYLYRATRDPFYLDVGERVLFDLTTRAKVNCGLSGIQDLRTNKQDDRMESFALSETLKYLYLLFDEENPLHDDDSNYVFTTEGHILTLNKDQTKPKSTRKRSRKFISHQCPAYVPFGLHEEGNKTTGLARGIRARTDTEYARYLVGNTPSENDKRYWSPDGWCEKPKASLYSYEFVLAPNSELVPEDLSPSLLKLAVVPNGFIIHNVTGIRTRIIQRIDGKGYDIRKLGHYSVRPGQTVYINDSLIFSPGEATNLAQNELRRRSRDVDLQFFTTDVDPMLAVQTGVLDAPEMDITLTGYTGLFGADLSNLSHQTDQIPQSSLKFGHSEGLPVYQDRENDRGCEPYKHSYPDSVLIVHRGSCTFLDKLLHARSASAAGIVVISDEDAPINPTANQEDLEAAGNLNDTALVLLTNKVGKVLLQMIDAIEGYGSKQVMVVLPRGRQNMDTDLGHIPEDTERGRQDEKDQQGEKDTNRILYINGFPLLNTRLLV